MAVGHQSTETLVCYCFELTERQLRTTIDTIGLRTVEEVVSHTSAGAGCTACHCRLRRLLAGLPARCGEFDTCDTCGFAAAECACRMH